MSEKIEKTSVSDAAVLKLRESISEVDRGIIAALAQRRVLSAEVAKAKSENGVILRDIEREQQLLSSYIAEGKELGLDSYYVTQIFRSIIDNSRRVQRDYILEEQNESGRESMSVAYQGIEGAFSHIAAQKHFANSSKLVSFHGQKTFDAVVSAVESGDAQLGFLPIENSTSGGINEVYDLLRETSLAIVGEELLTIEHCLLGLKGADRSAINKVICHPLAVAQCSKFLANNPGWNIEYFSDTAASSRHLKDLGDEHVAVIASKESAELFGLEILQENIANQSSNQTRFIIVGQDPIVVDSRIPAKVSLSFATTQRAGALVDILSIFQNHNIPLSKLESRPILDTPWEEMFYVDIDGNITDESVKSAIDEATKKARFIKVLGCYPNCQETQVPVQVVDGAACSNDGVCTPVARKDAAKSIPKAYKLASRQYKAENTVITVGNVCIGDGSFVIMGGPCSVEGEEQIYQCAAHAKDTGAAILRGGCFKPRTNPYSFQGMGYEGLRLLKEAGSQYDLPVVTEVLAAEDVAAVAAQADMLQIGARNMQNFALLNEVGKTRRPVLLKRGMSASISELLQAAEYILNQGNQQVVLCERGIRTFETATRSTLDLSAVPVLKELTHLPVIVDPSHAAGVRDLVPPLAYAAKSVGADGLIVEFHPEPEKALSDGPQALYFEQFRTMMQTLKQIA